MAHGKPRDARKEHQWRQWIHQWQHSGLSVRAYCARQGLTQASFYAWRRTLRSRDGGTASAFLPVRVVADEPAVPVGSVEVLLSGGRCLRVSPGFDPATLRQLLVVLAEALPC